MKLDSFMKKYLPLLILFFLLIAIVLTYYLAQKPQELRKKAVPLTSVAFSPSILNVQPNTSFSLDATISTGTNLIAGVELNIKFNPTLVKINSISLPAVPFLPDIVPGSDQINNTLGTARVILLSDPSIPKQGSGTLVTLQMTSLQLGNSQISFDVATKVSAVNEPAGTNVVYNMTPAQILIALPSPTPTPLPITQVRIHPGAINTITGQTIYLSALAYSNNTPRNNGVTYLWGISSVYSIGTLSSKNDLAEFHALNPGTGDLWVTATDQTASITKSIPITVLAAPLPTPTPTPTTASVNIKLKFESVFTQKADKTVKVILKQNNQTKYLQNMVITADLFGNYSNNNMYPLTNVVPGTYDVFVKGPSHLTRKFSGQTLAAGDNTLDLTAQVLLAGDAVIDDAVNVYDYTDVVDNYKCGSVLPPLNKLCNSMLSDYNFDGIIYLDDYNYMIGNFEVVGDK